jgi:hypothetical protein
MKKLLVSSAIVLGTLHAIAQGTVTFNNRVVGSVVTHVYAPLARDPGMGQIGNGTADTPPGTTDWSGYTLIGANGITGRYGGGTTVAQLLSAPGYNQPESSLTPQATRIATFRTGAAAGFIQGGITATLSNVGNDSAATLEMVAWDNSSGLYPTWAQARTAWFNGLIAAGMSGTWNSVVGGTSTPPNITGAQSFNLVGSVPEPSLPALVGLSVTIMTAFRRR